MNITEDKIYLLIRKISLPILFAMVFTTLYNFTDTYFAGQISNSNALAGIGATFPIFLLIGSISAGMQSGTSSIIGGYLGEGKKQTSVEYAKQGVVMGFILSGIIILLSNIIISGLLDLLGIQGDARYFAQRYIYPIYIASSFFIVQAILNGILSIQGNTKPIRNITIVAFFINIVLDYMFVKIFNLDTLGVSIATIMVQFVVFAFTYYQVKKSDLFKNEKSIFAKIDFAKVKDILRLAIPSTLSMVAMTIGIFILNFYAQKIGGNSGNAAISLGQRLEQLFLMPVSSLGTAIMSIGAQNFGARKIDRVKEVYTKALTLGVILMVIGSFIIALTKNNYAAIMTSDINIQTQTIDYLNVSIFTLPGYAFLMLSGMIMTAIKKPRIPMTINIARQVILPATVFTILYTSFNATLNMLWVALFFITWSMGLLAFLVAIKNLQKLKSK